MNRFSDDLQNFRFIYLGMYHPVIDSLVAYDEENQQQQQRK